MFSDFAGDDFFNGTRETILLNSFTQKEGLGFLNDSLIYFSNESSFLGAAQLSLIELEPANIGLSTEQTPLLTESVRVYPNPVSNLINLKFDNPESSEISVSLYNLSGQLVKSFENRFFVSGEHQLSYEVSDLSAGSYILNLKGQNINFAEKVVLIH